jgi:uncharacterized protein
MPVADQEEILTCLRKSDIFMLAYDYLKESKLKDWYITAGFIQQAYYNWRHGFETHYSIKDIDIAYFDENPDYENNDERIERELTDLISKRLTIDVKNQAFVHLWYKSKFGYDIPLYKNVLDAIDSFPTTSTAIGITDRNGAESLYSTFGLDDLYNMILRPNKRQITKAIYESKKRKIEANWPMVKVVAWGS